jgi:hypothetical protein
VGLLQELFGDDDAAISEGFYRKLDAMHADLRRLSFIVSQGDRNTMSTLAQLDAAIAADATEEASLTSAVGTLTQIVTIVDNDIAELLAKVAAGTPVDVTAELTAIQKNTAANVASVTAIQAAVTSATAADASVNPPAAAPAAPSTPPAASS